MPIPTALSLRLKPKSNDEWPALFPVKPPSSLIVVIRCLLMMTSTTIDVETAVMIAVTIAATTTEMIAVTIAATTTEMIAVHRSLPVVPITDSPTHGTPEPRHSDCPSPPDLSAMVYATVCSKKITQRIIALHKRMGHASKENMVKAIQHGAWCNCSHTAAQVSYVMAHHPCLICAMAKKNKIPISVASDPRPPCPGHTIAADPMVGISPLTRQGYGLCHCFKCVFTSKDHVFPSASKTDFLSFFKYVVNWYADYGWTVRIFRCDMEAVLNSREVQDYLDSKHIRVQNSAPYSHWQNTAERNIQTLSKLVATTMHDQPYLPASFWGDGITFVANVRGHVPNKILGNKSPMQAITGNPTNLANTFMFYFGQPVLLAKVEPEKTFKFDVRNDVGLYLGQPEGQVDAHFIWLPYYQKLVNRSGATALNITQAQYDTYYSRQTQMLQPRIISNTLQTLLDFGNLSIANDYNRIEHLQQYNNPTLATTPIVPTLDSYIASKLLDTTTTDEDNIDSEGAIVSDNLAQEGVENQSFTLSLPYTDTLPTTIAINTTAESTLDRILSYTGDPADWKTLEFKVLYSDGEIRYHFYPAVSPTQAFAQFQLTNAELSQLEPLSEQQLSQYNTPSGRKKKRVRFRYNLVSTVEPTPIPIPASFNKRQRDSMEADSEVKLKAQDLSKRTTDDDLDDPYLYPYDDHCHHHRLLVAHIVKELLSDEPTVKKALLSSMRDDWITAIKAEVLNLIETGTIKQAMKSDIKPGDQLIYFTMKLKVKRYADGQVERLKARGCAMGNMLSQMPGMQNYSPTVSAIVAAACLAMATFFHLSTCTVDTVSAYLMQAYKEEPALFIKFPMNVCIAADLDPDIIYRIYKYVYGLPDAGRAYYIALSNHLTAGGYIRSNFDPCLFYKFVGKDLIILSIHVDDTFVAASIQQLIEEFKDYLRLKFQITFKDIIHTYLGVQHTLLDTNQLQLTQTKLLNQLFEELGISSETSQQTAAIENSKVVDPDGLYPGENYRQIVGLILYCLHSRPDCSFIVSEAATHNTKPTNSNFNELLNATQYLYNTKDLGLTLPTNGNFYDKSITITCWVDASYLTHPTTAKSHTGYCFSLGRYGMFYSKSSVQQLVATSSTHAEMRALFTAVKDLVFLIGLFEELGFTVTLPVTVYEDNNACVILANQEIGPNKKIRHFLMIVEYCRQQVYLGNIRVEHIDTEENIADILTKNIYNTKLFQKHRDQLLGNNKT